MDLDKIQVLMDRFEDSDIRELKIDEGNFHLYLSKNKADQKSPVKVNTTKEQTVTKEESAPKQAPIKEKPEGKPVKAPIVGIVYLQSKPGEPAFVNVGDHVKKGDTIAIIEAMKMMTEIKSDITGTVSAINVENEDLVEVGQPLITVKE
ncbi:acetyl-CoA carboxylase biotin carboxyl carrier protein [Lactobacillus ultunensis]|uniref:Biotin carboxyl carrier protein of acetyl-CoA carboxylase n=1 Tax=Lactobacillus ultunensis DSM 16047 TaxID=525365 RepID=C2EKV8_9LACO|nr:acetyl-CoA carboxylase biotin carboxyl carrier protein [Lactobacillus ultunensis]EEJ72815.1 acetyl-CoA carboxylase, biotin carboxyl carrier protein [Lactobacillus ultunensis DSM 16047]KRL83122.1 acetyl-CoA carboxylase biotin carboxyl carrier subunit [Lactobacillus ultunensis DSM 16047]QQP29188.1 acetyl-CoA carboxylase biotin carboxyl carrier protein [Lactobacillus ultunensis]